MNETHKVLEGMSLHIGGRPMHHQVEKPEKASDARLVE